MSESAEHKRLEEARTQKVPWRQWGPYLSDRQWGTVREDYSDDGAAWEYFPHDHARMRAYRWGEDGLAGFSDEKQQLCFALALWNGKDPILKERLFGLTNAEGNHGEDVKEYYFYLDATPTHSWQRFLYKYPQSEFPYAQLVDVNRARSRTEAEYELLDTGVFDQDRYFDVFVEYAKADAQDVLIRITIENRGSEKATLHVLPTLWMRNTWSWGGSEPRPRLAAVPSARGTRSIGAKAGRLGKRWLHCEGSPELYFTENESNAERLWGQPNASPYVKDGIHERVIHGRGDAVAPAPEGTKAAAHYVLDVPARGSASLRLRLNDSAPDRKATAAASFGKRFDQVLERRSAEADEFYAAITPPGTSADRKRVMRQALAGMLWTKQYYYFDLNRWLAEHQAHPMAAGARSDVRNRAWVHMINDDIISMPDKWEYPWYAAWDLAFHSIALSAVDLDFAKAQLQVVLRDMYLHPSGQIPAYEWNFGDVNPPVHAWATRFMYGLEKDTTGKGDFAFLESAFQKLLLNFTWWVNRKDPAGRNVFEGGFLGLDNIGVFDRSAPLPTGGALEQADGTAWMVLFSVNMVELALELMAVDPAYEDMALKFVQHFLWIASAMDKVGDVHDKLWDEEDGFFYDVLRLPDGRAGRLKGALHGRLAAAVRGFGRRVEAARSAPRAAASHRELRRRAPAAAREHRRHPQAGRGRPVSARGDGRDQAAPRARAHARRERVPQPLRTARALTRAPRASVRDGGPRPRVPRSVRARRVQLGRLRRQLELARADLVPGQRPGPARAARLLRLLRRFVPRRVSDGSGNMLTLIEVFEELSDRLTRIFLRDEQGRRPVYGGATKFQEDPHWRDHILFYEYFHGDNGAGLGASHQTGWTGLVAKLVQMSGSVRARDVKSGMKNVPRLPRADAAAAGALTGC
jgi:hypothetical protein